MASSCNRSNIDFRFDYTFKIKKVRVSIYVDIWNLQYIWHKNVIGYRYDRRIFLPGAEEYIAGIKPGDPVPDFAVRPMEDLPIIPLLGFRIWY